MNFIYLNWTPILFPFIVGVLKFRYLELNLKIVFFYVCFGTFTEVFTRSLMWLAQVNNTMPLVHVALLISYLFLFVFYDRILSGFVKTFIIRIFVALLVVFWIVNSLLIQSIYPSLPVSIGSLAIIVLSIIYFYKVMVEAKIVNLTNEPLIWVNTAVLIYFTANLFFNILFNLIVENSIEFSKITVYYFSALNALFYILIAIGFLKTGRSKLVG